MVQQNQWTTRSCRGVGRMYVYINTQDHKHANKYLKTYISLSTYIYIYIHRIIYRYVPFYILYRPNSSHMWFFSCKTLLPYTLRFSGVCHLTDLTDVCVDKHPDSVGGRMFFCMNISLNPRRMVVLQQNQWTTRRCRELVIWWFETYV